MKCSVKRLAQIVASGVARLAALVPVLQGAKLPAKTRVRILAQKPAKRFAKAPVLIHAQQFVSWTAS